MCECGHTLLQHPDKGQCDYSPNICSCVKYKRAKRDSNGSYIFTKAFGKKSWS
jgi:hypothetical protein